MPEAPVATTDRPLLRGVRTRQAILSHASRLASAEGLEAVSLQRLATDLGISKSGLFAHFGSKEELQLAIVDEVSRIFTDEVLKPGLKTPAGVGRVWAMCNAFLSYLKREVFPGGCFFEATVAEFDSKPGRGEGRRRREARLLGRQPRPRHPRRQGQRGNSAGCRRRPGRRAARSCFLVGANGSFVQNGGSVGLERARRAIRDRLERIATASAPRLPTR